MGKIEYNNSEHKGKYGKKVQEITKDCVSLKMKILSQCTNENLRDHKSMSDDDSNVLLHYQLPSGLHVYGMTQNFSQKEENKFSELWQIVVLGEEGNIYGGCANPKSIDERRIHNPGLYDNGIYLYLDGDKIGLGISQKQVEPCFSSRFVTANVTLFPNDRITTDVRQHDNRGEEETKKITADLEDDARSICDIFRTGILENDSIESNTKRRIIEQLDGLQSMLDNEKQKSRLSTSSEKMHPEPIEDARGEKINEVLAALNELGLSEDEWENLKKQVVIGSQPTMQGLDEEIK